MLIKDIKGVKSAGFDIVKIMSGGVTVGSREKIYRYRR